MMECDESRSPQRRTWTGAMEVEVGGVGPPVVVVQIIHP